MLSCATKVSNFPFLTKQCNKMHNCCGDVFVSWTSHIICKIVSVSYVTITHLLRLPCNDFLFVSPSDLCSTCMWSIVSPCLNIDLYCNIKLQLQLYSPFLVAFINYLKSRSSTFILLCFFASTGLLWSTPMALHYHNAIITTLLAHLLNYPNSCKAIYHYPPHKIHVFRCHIDNMLASSTSMC